MARNHGAEHPGGIRRCARGAAGYFAAGSSCGRHDASFGGLSGFEVLEDGRFVARATQANGLMASLVLDANGNLTGVANVRTALMRDERGQPFESKDAGDAEDLTQLPDGRFAVSFEQTQSIRIYDLNRDGPFGAASRGRGSTASAFACQTRVWKHSR